MIIIWGTKVYRKTLGQVAEICRTCEGVSSQKLSEVRKVSHIYYLSLGRGTVVGHEVSCSRCGNACDTALDRYRGVSKRASLDAEELVRSTNPAVHQELAEWKDMQERARGGELDPAERIQVIQERLLDIARKIEERASRTHLDLQSGLALLVTLFAPWFLIVPAQGMEAPWNGVLMYMGLGVGGAGLLFSIYSAFTDVSRFIRRCLREDFVRILRPFNPSPGELETILDGFKQGDWAMGKKVRSAWIQEVVSAGPGLGQPGAGQQEVKPDPLF
jgi:hypothetical protein